MTVPEALAAAIEYAAKSSVTEASLARGQCYLRARHMQQRCDQIATAITTSLTRAAGAEELPG